MANVDKRGQKKVTNVLLKEWKSSLRANPTLSKMGVFLSRRGTRRNTPVAFLRDGPQLPTRYHAVPRPERISPQSIDKGMER